MSVVVIGAGMGGLAASLQLRRLGYEVELIEGRTSVGGLASGQHHDGLAFDAGPYILLDRPGLEWAFAKLGLDLSRELELRRVDTLYEVESAGNPAVRFHADRARTADEMERHWPGSGARYLAFVDRTSRLLARVLPLQRISRPRVFDVLRSGAWRDVPFLLSTLEAVLRDARLPRPVVDAIGIWTHVAGQSESGAPSPMALIPAMVHGVGAFYPKGGIAAVPRALGAAVERAGVRVRLGTRVRRILVEGGRARGIETEAGETIAATTVVAASSGVGTYLDLLPPPSVPSKVRRHLESLPLQSPGVCAYLRVHGGAADGPYLRFLLPVDGSSCRSLVQTAIADPDARGAGAAGSPARLLSPIPYERARLMTQDQQSAHLDGLLREEWWQRHVTGHEVLARRGPREWGADFNLFRESMNPVMTARLMRRGRLAHRSPHVRGLYLAGSSTHPGQWVSFCAISGVLAAEAVKWDDRR